MKIIYKIMRYIKELNKVSITFKINKLKTIKYKNYKLYYKNNKYKSIICRTVIIQFKYNYKKF